MNLFGGVVEITGVPFQLFIVFAVIFAGYLIGKIEIKGVSLGTAGVFIAALLFGFLFSADINEHMDLNGEENAFLLIENTGLVLFVGSVGMMAGPGFFRNLKKYFTSYFLIGLIITVTGALSTLACYFLHLSSVQIPAAASEAGITKSQYLISMMTGIMSGSLTSTPAFSASQDSAAALVSPDAANIIRDVITTGHAIAYLFGVIGVVLFVQLVPRLLKADMQKERELISTTDPEQSAEARESKGRFQIDSFGFAALGLVVVVGIFIGMIKIPLSGQGLSGTTFSLTTTGGVLISGIIFSHFGHIGPISLKADDRILEALREFGLVLFLIGAGIPGGASFLKYFQLIYFVYGLIITVIPMLIGYFVASKLLRLPLLNALGSITGGMTSTPALGALIRASGTDDVASSYAAAYPFALISIVLSSQFLIVLLG